MNLVRFAVTSGLAVVLSSALVSAQEKDELQLLKKMKEAMLTAPGLRMTSTITDRDNGAVVETIVIERVAPNKIRFVTTRNGQPGSEMISDGTRSLRRAGPNDPWKTLPLNLSQLFEKTQSAIDEESVREQHAQMKPLGDGSVDGVAAKIYELSTDHGTAKLWLAPDTARPLKMESDSTGPIAPHGFKKDSKGMPDIKALRDQLKAASVAHHLHTTMTYNYDSSLKIEMPAG
jgi:hypothetical protein